MSKHPLQGKSVIEPLTRIDGPRSTPQEMADWCNNLSKHLNINRDRPNDPYYLPPAIAEDFPRK